MKTHDGYEIVPQSHSAPELEYGLDETDLMGQIELYKGNRDTWDDIIFSGGFGRSLKENVAFIFQAWQAADNLIGYMESYLETRIAEIEDEMWEEQQKELKKKGDGNAGKTNQ